MHSATKVAVGNGEKENLPLHCPCLGFSLVYPLHNTVGDTVCSVCIALGTNSLEMTSGICEDQCRVYADPCRVI